MNISTNNDERTKVKTVLDTINNEVLAEARQAAVDAAASCTPTPVVWVGSNGTRFPEPEGMCGNAYIKMPMVNNKFALWCKKNAIGHKSFMGGWALSIPHNGSQSYERHVAAARAFAAVLTINGVKCAVHDYID